MRAQPVHLRPLAGAVLLSAGGAAPVLLTGAIAVQLQADIGLSEAALGAVVALYFGLGGVTAIFGGRLADRLGWRRASLFAALLSLVTLVGIAVFVRSPTSLVVMLTLGGLTLSLTGPAANLILAREMPVHRRGLTFGIKQSSIPLASMFAGVSVPTIALTIGWRWAFVAAAAFPLVAAGVLPRRVRAVARPAERNRRSDPARRHLLVLAAASGAGMAAAASLSTFLVISTVAAGWSEATAGGIYALSSAAGLVVRVVAGWLADHRRVDGFGQAAGLLALGTLGFGLLATELPLLVLPGAILAVGAGWGWAGLFFFGVVTRFPDAPASATGVIQAGMSVGAALGPVCFGLLVGASGYRAAWFAMGLTSLSAATLVRRATRARTNASGDASARDRHIVSSRRRD